MIAALVALPLAPHLVATIPTGNAPCAAAAARFAEAHVFDAETGERREAK